MSKGAYPSFVKFSLDDHHQETDDRSELTGSCCSDDLSQEDTLGINLAADPYYYHTPHGSHPFLPEKQELLELKLQISRQQEKIDTLSSKLSQCENENEALKAEKAILFDGLPLEAQEETTTKREELSLRGNSDNAGPLKMLVDLNANLTTENARLQAIVGVTRKAFKSYINESRLCSDKHKQTIKDLRRGNGLPQQGPCACKIFKRSLSEHTAKTSLRSSLTESIIEDAPFDFPLQRDSLIPDPEQGFNFGALDDDWSAKGEEIEATNNRFVIKRATRRKTVDCISGKDTIQAFVNENASDNMKDFGANETRRSRAMGRRHTVEEGTASKKADDLLVNFCETRRPHGTVKRWSSLKSLRVEL